MYKLLLVTLAINLALGWEKTTKCAEHMNSNQWNGTQTSEKQSTKVEDVQECD